MSSSAPDRVEIAARCLAGRCPDCDTPLPPGAPWCFPSACEACGMVFRRHEGFYLGAFVWNYGMVAFGVLPWLVVAWRFHLLERHEALTAAAVICFTLPAILYRTSWKLWLASHYAMLPHQLPSLSNRSKDIDD